MAPAPSNKVAALPDQVHLAAESQWLFTTQELLRSPSILDGLPLEKERENRGKGVNFIVQVGIMLRLPQITLATASIFLQRFYMRHSMQSQQNPHGFHYYAIAATSLFLATKVEENCRKMKELVIACARVAQKDPYKVVDEQDKEYWRWRDNILVNEGILLEALCFDLRLESPYKMLYDILLKFGEEENKKLRNAAWAFISDSCLTTLCLLFPSRLIAASALYAAARHSGVAFPDDQDGKPWWEGLDAKLTDIGEACSFMAEVYRGPLVKGSRELDLYEKSPTVTHAARDLTRGALAAHVEVEQLQRESSQAHLKRTAATESHPDEVNHLTQDDVNTDSNKRKRQRLVEGHPEAWTEVRGENAEEVSSSTYEPKPQTPIYNASTSTETITPAAPGLITTQREPATNEGGNRLGPQLDISEEGEVEM